MLYVCYVVNMLLSSSINKCYWWCFPQCLFFLYQVILAVITLWNDPLAKLQNKRYCQWGTWQYSHQCWVCLMCWESNPEVSCVHLSWQNGNFMSASREIIFLRVPPIDWVCGPMEDHLSPKRPGSDVQQKTWKIVLTSAVCVVLHINNRVGQKGNNPVPYNWKKDSGWCL